MSGLWVFLGGGTGAALRWGIALVVPQPGATILVNVVGSFALAILLHPGIGASSEARLLLGVGCLGGFTTYSTFNASLVAALQEGRYAAAGLEAAVTLLGALAAGFAGWWLAGVLAARQ